jgi:hypothetical protein
MSQARFVEFFDMCRTARQGRGSYCLLFQVFGPKTKKASLKRRTVIEFFSGRFHTLHFVKLLTFLFSLQFLQTIRLLWLGRTKPNQIPQAKYKTVMQNMLALRVMRTAASNCRNAQVK